MSGRNRRVRGEHALIANSFDVLAAYGSAPSLLRFFPKQLQRQQRRMPFIHVVARQVGVAQGIEHAHAADPQQHFLPQPVVRIATIQCASQGAVCFGVGR